jgi:CRP-like cAMP-binding protein
MLSTIEKVILLQKIDEFAEVPTAQLAQLATITVEVSKLKGDVIFKENDPPDALYIALEGRVALTRGDQEISVVEKDGAFGISALFDEEPRMVTATALEDCSLLTLDREEFFDLLSDHLQIVRGIIKAIVKRLRELAEKVDKMQKPDKAVSRE